MSMNSVMKTFSLRFLWFKNAWPFLWYILLTMIWAWPLLQNITTSIAGYGNDPLFQMWTIAWVAHALQTNPGQLWDAPIFYPYPNALAFSDHHIVQAIIAFPLLVIDQPILAYNLLVLLSFVLSGWAVFLLTQSILSEFQPQPAATFGALLAGSLFAFSTYRMTHLMHLQMLQTCWLPLALYWLRQQSTTRCKLCGKSIVLTGIFAGLQSITAVYYAPMAALVLGLMVVMWYWPTHWRLLSYREINRKLVGLAFSGIIAIACALPFFLPYVDAYRSLGITRSIAELERWSAPLQAFFSVPDDNFVNRLTSLLPTQASEELNLFPGFGAIALSIGGIWLLWKHKQRDCIGWFVVLMIGLVFSFGTGLRISSDSEPLPLPSVYRWIYDWVPGVKALRVTARWWMVGSLALAILAGAGFSILMQYWKKWIIVSIAALSLIEHLVIPIPLISVPSTPKVYQWLARTNPTQRRVVLELPLPPRIGGGEMAMRRQLYQMQHWRTIVTGYSGLVPIGSSLIFQRLHRLPDDETIRFLAYLGFDTLIIHRDELSDTKNSITLLEWAEQTHLLRFLTEVDDALVYEIRSDPILNKILNSRSEVFLSGSDQIPGSLALAFLRQMQQSGSTIYGPGKQWFYGEQTLPPAGKVFDYVVLGQNEDRFRFGVTTDAIWQAEETAIYQVPDHVLAIYNPGWIDAGQFHPRYPTTLHITFTGESLEVDGKRVPLRKAMEQAYLLIEVASLQMQEIRINDQQLALMAGGQLLVLDLFEPKAERGHKESARFQLAPYLPGLEKPQFAFENSAWELYF